MSQPRNPLSTPGARLRKLLAGGTVLAPFVFDGVQARLAERAGFSAVYMSGFGTAAAHGLPDTGLLGLAEMAANASRIAAAVSVPVIADADTGYGGPENVAHTVDVYERAGVAALHIEDQEWPKRCGFLEGKRVIPAADMVEKVRAACGARRDPEFLIIARTDALAPAGWDEALRRVRAYRAAGADLVFMDGLRTRTDIERAAEELHDIPQILNSWLLTPNEVSLLGFAVYIHLGVMLRHFADFSDTLRQLRDTGSVGLSAHDTSVEPITRLLSRQPDV